MLTNLTLFITLSIICLFLLAILDMEDFVYLTIISLFFPIYLQFLGRDALTTGSVCILLLFLKYTILSFWKKHLITENYDILIYLLITLGTASTLFALTDGTLSKLDAGRAVRQYVGFLTSLLLFLVVKNDILTNNRRSKDDSISTDYPQNIMSLLIILIALQILLSLTAKFFPMIGHLLSFFLSKPEDIQELTGIGDEVPRLATLVFSYEQLAELLAMTIPLVLYKIYNHFSTIWITILVLYCIGILLTITRSGILLFFIGLSISSLFYLKTNIAKTTLMIIFTLIAITLFIYLSPKTATNIFTRFYEAADEYEGSHNIFQSMNRGFLPDVFNYVFINISFIGHSLLRPVFNNLYFHNLYLTTLHQLGVFGSLLFFLILFKPLIQLCKAFKYTSSSQHKILFISCLLAMTLFFINEFKFEFTRDSSSQQIYFVLFALFYTFAHTDSTTSDPASIIN